MMDAVEFLEQLKKRSKSNPDYYGEELNIAHIEPISLVSQVEQWAAEHPIKTRQSEFLKLFPYARVKKANGLPIVSPCDLDVKLAGKCEGIPCQECRKKFWLAEVEDV
nr:MAG TPA: Paired amphipathic helix protein [Caudoviricetes sp.]